MLYIYILSLSPSFIFQGLDIRLHVPLPLDYFSAFHFLYHSTSLNPSAILLPSLSLSFLSNHYTIPPYALVFSHISPYIRLLTIYCNTSLSSLAISFHSYISWLFAHAPSISFLTPQSLSLSLSSSLHLFFPYSSPSYSFSYFTPSPSLSSLSHYFIHHSLTIPSSFVLLKIKGVEGRERVVN